MKALQPISKSKKLPVPLSTSLTVVKKLIQKGQLQDAQNKILEIQEKNTKKDSELQGILQELHTEVLCLHLCHQSLTQRI